jgi:hypothetical protein
MATMADLLADLNDRLNDVGNTQAPEATKIRWINRGVAAMWPRIYRTISDTSVVVDSLTYEYALPATFNEAEVYRVEVEDGVATNRFLELDGFGFDIVPGIGARTLQLPYPTLLTDGARIRISATAPLSQMPAVGSTFDGRAIHEELPVWYALGIAESRRLDDRVDHRRYSTTVAQNGVDINEVMNASQFCFAQFETLLERMAMAPPASVG